MSILIAALMALLLGAVGGIVGLLAYVALTISKHW